MSFEDRQEIIEELESIRGSRIITHINSDRRANGPKLPSLTTKLATEAQPFFNKILEDIGKQEQIDLFLYTRGGQTDAVWPLVSIIREYCDKFNVIAPYKAHSAGTLICLAADELILPEGSELSPVDPATGTPFNPLDEINNSQRKIISVEDVTSYFMLAQNPSKREEIQDEVDANLVFELLAKEVHPLALGKVNRSHIQIRELASRLLSLNNSINLEENEVNTIVNTLTQGRYSHTDILNRNEVLELLHEKSVTFPIDHEKELILNLFKEYQDVLKLTSPFVLSSEMEEDREKVISLTGGFIETSDRSYVFKGSTKVSKNSKIPPNVNIQIQAGQGLPLIPGLPVEYNIELQYMGWTENQEDI